MDKMDKREVRKCQVCGKDNGSCFYKEDGIGRVIYCVCPGCAFKGEHPAALQARLDNKKIKRGKK